ncbi:MAG: multiheme c-type cytochrome [Planctomycetota bacterium]
MSTAGPKPRLPDGPKLRWLLRLVFLLFAALGVNAVYLLAVRVLEVSTGRTYQNLFYLQMFLLHLVLGVLLVVPAVWFALAHMRNTYNRRNRRAVWAGYFLFGSLLALLISGLVLTRIEGVLELNHPTARAIAYWVHLLAPLIVVWLYILHRLVGRRIRWRMGLAWAGVAAALALGMLSVQLRDPRKWNEVGPASGEQYFFPSLARTTTGNFIPASVLDNDQYCAECHQDAHANWHDSAHHFSSFNNPAYLFSILETRQAMMDRHGNVNGSRFCAGCHDPVPFFSGAFDDPKFDDPQYDLAHDEMAQAGITCTVCHSISHINSVVGNADYTIDEPIHYPFADSESAPLKWINRQLIKAKPRFHKATFLKPLHQSTEFCGTCHKVHLPRELNDYRWLRGQNHYDSFELSGVSGQGVSSFYYPEVAHENCNRCHMPARVVEHSPAHPNFGAKYRDGDDELTTVDHFFPGANSALSVLKREEMFEPTIALEKQKEILEGSVRIDLFGIREEGRIDGPLVPLQTDQMATLEAGRTYLVEAVIRTLTLGHHLTQGTADSNELWLDMQASVDGEEIGHSGSLDPESRAVDDWAYRVNAFVIDRNGHRINRRNAEDIFVALYNHQIPPGAATVVHYRLDIPADVKGELTLNAALRYRKFDTEYMAMFDRQPGEATYVNELPIITLGSNEVTLPIGSKGVERDDPSAVPAWQRWNDYGIGLLRAGQYRQAEEAFRQVEALGRGEGALNLARVYLAEGRVASDAPAALRRAREMGSNGQGTVNEWSLLWFSGLVNKQNGEIDASIRSHQQIVEGGFEAAAGRGFDFSRDYRLLNELADSLYLRGLQERGAARQAERMAWLEQARDGYLQTLTLDPENVTAHYGLQRTFEALGDAAQAAVHAELHAKYKVDDNARDAAVAAARRRYPAANHAAEAVAIYDLTSPANGGPADGDTATRSPTTPERGGG